ncbi:DUF4369 domain-containing protein [Maribacter aestuarii]|uniref:DUF4369 domain-containing protein n=1 Tax=Maribacter aestuarii TaxID=1130723 RepID=UPI00248CF8B7|nr:DUF4369 domain-containing protein [Maribacter aestuarii]
MKKLLAVLSISILLSSCGGDTENTMTLTGTIKGLKKGTLHFQHVRDTALITIDSLEIDGDGKFTFKTEVESPEIFYLYLDKKDNNDINDRITFFGEPGIINVQTNWNTFDTNAKITGSKSHDKLKEYRKVMSGINKRSLELMQMSVQNENPLQQSELDSIEQVTNNNVKRGYLYAINFALNNSDSYIAPYIALKEVPDANRKYLDSIFSVLSPEVADSKYGRELQEYLKNKE